MEKKHVVRFLREKRRGSYTLLVKIYAEEIASMSVKMALELIREDLEQQSHDRIDLNYFSLAKAISRSRKKVTGLSPTEIMQKWKFKDANEVNERQLGPGKFKLGKDVQ